MRRRKEEWAVGDNIQRSSNRVKGKPIRVIKGVKHESTSLFYNLIDDIVIFFFIDGAEAEDGYNLQRIRSSALGQSAPSLTANSVVSNFSTLKLKNCFDLGD